MENALHDYAHKLRRQNSNVVRQAAPSVEEVHHSNSVGAGQSSKDHLRVNYQLYRKARVMVESTRNAPPSNRSKSFLTMRSPRRLQRCSRMQTKKGVVLGLTVNDTCRRG